jgi:hypothetical protein
LNLPLFDPPPIVREPSASDVLMDRSRLTEPSTLDRSDVRRVIQHKAGPFREVLEAKVTGRTFRILELHSGQILCEWENGERFPVPSISPVYVADGLKFGTLVEVEA